MGNGLGDVEGIMVTIENDGLDNQTIMLGYGIDGQKKEVQLSEEFINNIINE